MLAGKTSKSADNYMQKVKMLMERFQLSLDAMVSEEFLEAVKKTQENQKVNNMISAGLKKFRDFMQERGSAPWEVKAAITIDERFRMDFRRWAKREPAPTGRSLLTAHFVKREVEPEPPAAVFAVSGAAKPEMKDEEAPAEAEPKRKARRKETQGKRKREANSEASPRKGSLMTKGFFKSPPPKVTEAPQETPEKAFAPKGPLKVPSPEQEKELGIFRVAIRDAVRTRQYNQAQSWASSSCVSGMAQLGFSDKVELPETAGMERQRSGVEIPENGLRSGEDWAVEFLDDSWFSEEEKVMVRQLEVILQGTDHAHSLARDMLTPLIYDLEIAFVLDDSGSMNLDMFGQCIPRRDITATTPWNAIALVKALRQSLPGGWFTSNTAPRPAECPISPHHCRWFFARHHLRCWKQVFSILQMDPWLYMLNGGKRCRLSELEQIFHSMAGGSTPMSQTIRQVLRDLSPVANGKSLLIVALTDGEANDMVDFNRVLDEIQNLRYGDVQVCLFGLSLIKEDIEWFENEECDETRIRTIEPFEVENRQIQLKEVTRREGGYTFDMHVMRGLVTNYYPADYDYEAPLQNLMHRVYITLHGRDRWWAIQNPLWYLFGSNCLCPACFLATGCHCCGRLQGNDCGKFEVPDCLKTCFE
ncbi:unnamed protein product [Durusdinium trenchii]